MCKSLLQIAIVIVREWVANLHHVGILSVKIFQWSDLWVYAQDFAKTKNASSRCNKTEEIKIQRFRDFKNNIPSHDLFSIVSETDSWKTELCAI